MGSNYKEIYNFRRRKKNYQINDRNFIEHVIPMSKNKSTNVTEKKDDIIIYDLQDDYYYTF